MIFFINVSNITYVGAGALALKGSEDVGLDEQLPSTFLNNFCASTVEAINLLAAWVDEVGKSEKIY